MLRGDCPVGGVKVTGYATPAARYCAISGGEYTVVANSGAEDEQGACTFKDGSQCDALEYYMGTCSPAEEPAPAESLHPPAAEVCNGMAQAMMAALNTEVVQSEIAMTDPTSGASGMGCRAAATGTGEQFTSPDATMKALADTLTGGGWEEDMMLAAGGPTGIGAGFRSGDVFCLASAMWTPDASANCPSDAPISTCEVTPAQQLYSVTLDCATSAPAAETAPVADITATEVITYTPGPPTGEARAGRCWTNSTAVWRVDAWRCQAGTEIYDPCFAVEGGIVCGANPATGEPGFPFTLTAPLPAPETPPDAAAHAWLVALEDGTVCEFATGASGGVEGERINYWCPSTDPGQVVVILGDLQPDEVWMANWAVLTGGPPAPTVEESTLAPIRTVWK
jgi:hypothetical protein